MADKTQLAMQKMWRIYAENDVWRKSNSLADLERIFSAFKGEDLCTFIRGALVGSAHHIGIEAEKDEFDCVPDSQILCFAESVLGRPYRWEAKNNDKG